MAETWRIVVARDGATETCAVEMGDVFPDSHPYWKYSAAVTVGGERFFAQCSDDADGLEALGYVVRDLHGAGDVVREIVPPGAPTAAEQVAAAVAAAVAAERAACLDICNHVADYHGPDEKRRGWPAQVGALDCAKNIRMRGGGPGGP